MSRIELNNGAVEGGLGAKKVTLSGPRTGALEFGKNNYRNGKGAYLLIPAQTRYYDLVNNSTDFTVEFNLRIIDFPPTGFARSILVHGAPYTSGDISWGLNILENGGDYYLQFVWQEDTTGSLLSKTWSRKFFKRTTSQIRIVFRFGSPDEFDLYVDNVFHSTIDNTVGTKRFLNALNAPIYIGGEGSQTDDKALHFKISDFRVWSAVLNANDSDVAKFTGRMLDPVGHQYEEQLEGWWRMDDGAGRIVKDHSRWGNHGYMGPGAIVVTNGKRAADGAVFLDGHTSFLQADLRWADLFRNEFDSFNFDTTAASPKIRFGISVRAAILDLSYSGAGAAGCRWAELSGGDKRDRPALSFGYNASGNPVSSYYWQGASRTLTSSLSIEPGKVKMWETFLDLDTTPVMDFYIDGNLEASASSPVPTTGPHADIPKQLRIGSSANYSTDEQTPWSSYNNVSGQKPVPLLVEEVRLWISFLDASGVSERWEKTLSKDQLIENMGAAFGDFTEGSTTVIANESPDTGFINAYLLTGDSVDAPNEDNGEVLTTPKIHHISNIVGTTITLSSAYEGKTVSGKGLLGTRLGGCWYFDSPTSRQVVEDTAEIRLWEDIAPKPMPDAEGDLVETTNGSQIGAIKILDDRGPAKTPLYYCLDPYEDNTAPGLTLPVWVDGLEPDDQDNPGRSIIKFETPSLGTSQILIHHSNGYRIDPRWRPDSPYEGDKGCLAFLDDDDFVSIPFDSSLREGSSATQYFAIRGWFKFDKTSGKRVLAFLGSWTSPGDVAYMVYTEAGRLKVSFAKTGNGTLYSTVNAPLEKDRWHYIEFTASPSFALFIDGVKEATTSTPIGGGGSAIPSVTDDILIGNVAEIHRNDYEPFSGQMADFEIVSNASSTSAFHTADYLSPSSRVSASTETKVLFPFNDGEDAIAFNQGSLGESQNGKVESFPFVPVMTGIGVPDDERPPSGVLFNERLYLCTGNGPPVVYDGKTSRRMGIVPPGYKSDVEAVTTSLWSTDAPAFVTGTHDQDDPEVNFSAVFKGQQQLRIGYVSTYGLDLSGNTKDGDSGTTSGARGDAGAFEAWFKPSRLDRKMTFMGKNWTKNSGNYWIVLIPNSDGNALKVRFGWWDLNAKAERWFETDNYPINSTSTWFYLLVSTVFGRASGSRYDYVVMASSPGGALNIWQEGGAAGNALVYSADHPSSDDNPDDTGGDVLWGNSGITVADKSFFGFEGLIHSVRQVTDTDRDVNHPHTPPMTTAPTVNFPRDPGSSTADFKEPLGTSRWNNGASTNFYSAGRYQTAAYVFRLNEGEGTSPEDFNTANPLTGSLESVQSIPTIAGKHRFRVTFYDPDTFVESNPGPESVKELIAPGQSDLIVDGSFTLSSLPVSEDTREKIYRRIYKTAADGSTYHLALEVQDNLSRSAVINIRDEVLTTKAVLSFQNSFPPRFTAIGADESRIFVGKMEVRKEEGGAGVLYSEPFAPESMPATNLIPLDSKEGGAVVAIATIFGQRVFFLRDAIFVASPASVGFSVSVVETDAGCVSPIGVVSAQRRLFRPAEQGIYAFNGVSDTFLGGPIKEPNGTWGSIDPARLGLMSGVYWRDRDQVIWVAKRKSDPRARTRIALDLTTGVAGEFKNNPPHVFTTSDGPNIATLGIAEDFNNKRELWGADHLGMVYILDSAGQELDGPRPGYGSVNGKVGAGSGTALVNVQETDVATVQEGHRGETLTVIQAATGQESSAIIISNTGSSFTLNTPLSFVPVSGDIWAIGAFRRFWRTGAIPYGNQDEMKKWGWLYLSFEPRNQGLMTVTAWVDFDQSTAFKVADVPMDKGWAQVSLFGGKDYQPSAPRGKFLQLEFSCRHPFFLYDYTVGERRSGPGR